MIETDIAIAGGGLAGLTAAARLAADGWSVVVVDASQADAAPDPRTTAFLQPAIATLAKAGIWSNDAPFGTALRTMRIVDAGGQQHKPRTTADFQPSDAGHDMFGWNVANAALGARLRNHLAGNTKVSVLHQTQVTGRFARMGDTLLRLSSGDQIRARLAVAADGRDSTLRQLAGIRARRWAYGQQALTFPVTMNQPHDGISTEIHRTGGPLTLVPLEDRDGQPAASIVWMMPGPDAARRDALDDAALSTELTAETMGLFGPLTVTGPRGRFPIISQLATAMRADRLALVAEAAHVMPPIGAQGLNTSLFDIETLAGLIAGTDDPGKAGTLARFQARTLPHTLTRVGGIDLLNRAAMAEAQPLRDLRNLGLNAINRIGPLRRIAVKAGLGV